MADRKSMRYVVEIYMPGGIDTVAMTFQTTSPPQAFHPGDIIDPRGWPDSPFNNLLEVVRVLHFIWEHPTEVVHKIGVATRQVPDTRASYFGA